MTSPDETPAASSTADGSPSFEESLAELQQIAHELEEGALGLEDSLKRFERGIALLRQCYSTLEQAEQRIEILTGFDAAGNAVTKPFDATATVDQNATPAAGKRKRKSGKPAKESTKSEEASSDSEADDDDTRLF